MHRGLLKTIIYSVIIVLVFSTAAQATPLRIVMLETMPVPVILQHETFFLEGLESHGYKLGESVIVDTLRADGDESRARTLLKGYLTNHNPDLVISFATLASRAAQAVLEGTNIPLVFCVVAGPVKAGLIKEVGQPTGTNVTGLVFSLLRQSKMDLAKSLLTQPFPARAVRIGIIHSSYPSAVDDVEKMKRLGAQDDSISFESYQLEYAAMPDGLNSMLTEAKKGIAKLSPNIDFWWIVPGPLGETDEFSKLLLGTQIPVGLCHTETCVKEGGLFYVSPSYKKSGYQVASMVDSIIKGTPAGEIPSVPPDNFDFGLNLSTAISLDIVIPSDFLELAGQNVWR